MKQATLCLLVKDGDDGQELLLAMKKRGFGVGKWNGVGGKFDPEKGDKDILTAAIREAEEEIGVKIKNMEKVALLSFYFPHISKEKGFDQDVHVFVAKDWEGEPTESEEMCPKWFKSHEVPFKEMWPDDIFWLPHVLAGKKLKAKFTFGQGEGKGGEVITDQDITIVEQV